MALLFPIRIECGWWTFLTISPLDFIVFAFFFLVIGKAALQGRLILGDLFVFTLLASPLAFCLISISWSLDGRSTAKSVIVYGSALAAYLETIYLFRSLPQKRLFTLIALIPFALILTATLSYLPRSFLRPEIITPQKLLDDAFLLSYKARFSHPFLGLSNSFATILAMFLPMSILIPKLANCPRWTALIPTLTLASIFVTGSRGVILAVLIVLGSNFLWHSMKTARLPISAIRLIVAATILASGFILINPIALAHITDRLQVQNIQERISAFLAALEVLNQYPFGIGAGIPLSSVSDSPLTSVHNAYIQNLLWFGWVGGVVLNIAMILMPYAISKIPVETRVGHHTKQALSHSIYILLLINFTQASWEGSIIRVWIYFIIALGMVFVQTLDRQVLSKSNGTVCNVQ